MPFDSYSVESHPIEKWQNNRQYPLNQVGQSPIVFNMLLAHRYTQD
jgi:hypothetical protein